MSLDTFINDMHLINNKSVELAKRLIVDSIWKEANIEGIGVTFPETQEIFEGRNISHLSIDEIVKINNLKHAWNFILTSLNRNVLHLSFINDINYEIGKNSFSNCGKIRQANVSISGTDYKPTIPNEYIIEDNIVNLVYTFSREELAIELGCYIMRQQFYIDGNKRTAQLWMNAFLIKNNYGILSISVDKKLEFTKLLIKYYETNDNTELKDFLHKCIIKE